MDPGVVFVTGSAAFSSCVCFFVCLIKSVDQKDDDDVQVGFISVRAVS